MRDPSPVSSNWRAQGTLRDYLTRHNIVAIGDIDTRALTKKLRSGGVMRGIIATGTVDPAALVEKARQIAHMEGSDLVKDVTCKEAYDFETSLADAVTEASFGVPPLRRAKRPLRVAAYDYGIKLNILRRLAAHGCQVRVFPGVDAGVGSAGVETRRHLPQQRPRRSGGGHLRDRQHQGDRRRPTCRRSASASAIS